MDSILKNGHLTDTALSQFYNGQLDAEELFLVAEHTAECPACAARLSGWEAARTIHPVPSGFTEEILRRIAPPPKNKKRELLFYSMRVGLAACAALVIVATSTAAKFKNWDVPKTKQIELPGEFKLADKINRTLQEFSNKLINMEDLKNDKPQK